MYTCTFFKSETFIARQSTEDSAAVWLAVGFAVGGIAQFLAFWKRAYHRTAKINQTHVFQIGIFEIIIVFYTNGWVFASSQTRRLSDATRKVPLDNIKHPRSEAPYDNFAMRFCSPGPFVLRVLLKAFVALGFANKLSTIWLCILFFELDIDQNTHPGLHGEWSCCSLHPRNRCRKHICVC